MTHHISYQKRIIYHFDRKQIRNAIVFFTLFPIFHIEIVCYVQIKAIFAVAKSGFHWQKEESDRTLCKERQALSRAMLIRVEYEEFRQLKSDDSAGRS